MLLELLSQSNYQSYNVKLAHILGLESAIYFNALLEINEKACRKGKVYEESFFLVDREYIKKRTTLNENKQLSIEKALVDCDLLELNNSKEYVKVCVDTLVSLLDDKNENVQKDLSKINKSAKASSKGEYMLNAVKRHINSGLPDELQLAYSEWLDVVYSKFGFVSKQMIIDAQSQVDMASNRDLDVALAIIHIASANGWKSMCYAVDRYRQQHTSINKVVENKNVAVSTEVAY